MYQLCYADFSICLYIYSWLANVYIDEEYCGCGYGRLLLSTVKDSAKRIGIFDELFGYTKHVGLYEKFGFEFVSEIDTLSKCPRIQRLLRLNLKDK